MDGQRGKGASSAGRPLLDQDVLGAENGPGMRSGGGEQEQEQEQGQESPADVGWRYRELLEHLPVGVYRTTTEGAIVECNRALAEMLGYPNAAALQAANARDFYVRREDRVAHMTSLRAGMAVHTEFELRRRDGSTLWVRDYSRAIPDERGGVAWHDGIIVDVTAERQAREALRRSEADYRGLFENAHDAIMIFEVEQETILAVNQRACELYGFDRSELVGMSLLRLSTDAETGRERIRETLKGTVTRSFETVHLRKDGTRMVVDVNAAVVEHRGQRAILSINRDVTERKRMEETIRAMALHDPLTGLPNRKLLYDRLGLAIAAARRNRRMLALLYLDLDGFKEVNDRRGHAAGDELLTIVAARLLSALRDSDTVGRMGGDEFTILIPEVRSEGVATEVAKKVLAELRRPIVAGGEAASVTASLGIAVYPEDGGTAEALLRSADAAMYHAKATGKDRCARVGSE